MGGDRDICSLFEESSFNEFVTVGARLFGLGAREKLVWVGDEDGAPDAIVLGEASWYEGLVEGLEVAGGDCGQASVVVLV